MDVPRAIIHQGFLLIERFIRQGHEITAHRHIPVGKLNAEVGGLERRPAGIALLRIITQHRQVGHIAAGSHPVRDGPGKPHLSRPGQGIHRGLVRGLHGGFPAEGLAGHIRHPVAQQHYLFHRVILSFQKEISVCF